MLSTEIFSKQSITQPGPYDKNITLNSKQDISMNSQIRMRPKLGKIDHTKPSRLSLPPMDNHVPYKITSKINNSRSQVRFSIPDLNMVDDDCSYISISNSPQKIVFPREPIENRELDDEELTSIYSDSQISSLGYLRDFKSPTKREPKNLLKDKLNLVDLQTKVMIDVPESIWKYHESQRKNNNSKNTPGHRKTKSMHNIFNPYRDMKKFKEPNSSFVSQEWVPSHQRSKSLQSIIAETVKIYHEEDQTKFNDDTSLSTFNETVSTVSPLNIRQPGVYSKSTKKSHLFLTSESPLNKYKVSVPLEINLPPYLSPQNKEKNYHRKNLIYNGQGYSTFNEDSEDTTPESERTKSLPEEDEGSSFILDSLIGDDSLPFATNDISIDVGNKTVEDTDVFLGIDEQANVNLKLQNRNIRSNSKTPKRPPLPTKDSQFKFPSSTTKDIVSPNKVSLPQDNTKPNSEALEILATPSKSIVIPCLDDADYQTPKNPSTNGSLKFFENFEPLSNEDQNTLNIAKDPSRVNGKLNLAFKFPFNKANNRTLECTNNNSVEETTDFLKVAPTSVDRGFEERRQRLIHNQSVHKSPVNKLGHAHRRTQSIHNIEFTVFDDMIAPQSSFDAASTPQKDDNAAPEVPDRSPFRNLTSVVAESPVIKISPPPEKTQDSIILISERIISSSPKLGIMNASRPLSSIQSFSKPVSYKDIRNMHANENIVIPDDILTNKTAPIKNFNSLSPRRSLSNNGSHQSSSATSYTNSQFSKASFTTVDTDMEAIQEITETELIKKNNIPANHPSTSKERKKENDSSFEIVKEIRDGKEIDVIILDDVEEPLKATSKRKKKSSRTRLPKNKDYNTILDMCENTASEAKDIIYKLVSETEPLNVNENGEKSMQNISSKNDQRERYLKRFNRTMRVTSNVK
ncbi:similar to Saccharomyces cerevisiae YER032W FIR1 Protein involved in 3' mRNA processing, interacts with Ref2p [Maudiozyma saulgeensis]|uniref:Similar to Saccharomyces cerevisiae YER032W FIR1 Protein involved in 3' mRNA processing, interacts with Ref2p n=1 Tax=Maudiozyma saulgeensis TaxID=1789683 RepID=A0A1X7R4S6_9SACH|nr:similar to Saccharomyces cerevisiae YER032W FIR1 Protein involved in 3' mRNA processing, interacts with Ref2p [Kazachstania saulgeensis]